MGKEAIMAGDKTMHTGRDSVKITGSTVLVPHGEYEYKVDKLFFSAVKEEEWLNMLAGKGYRLVRRSFTGYIFVVDKTAAQYYYSMYLLPSQAESDYAKHCIENCSGYDTEPICTFSNKAYFKTPLGECSDGVVNAAVGKRSHLRRAFAFHFGLLLFCLGLLCYNLIYWVRFDALGVVADKSKFIWKVALNLEFLFGSYPTTPYISVCMVFVLLCIPFTVYYLDQCIYSNAFLRNVKKVWQKK